MFSYVKERKARAALDNIAPSVDETLRATSPVQRAAALAVANAMLLAGAQQWGRSFSHAPMRLQFAAACDAVCVIADRHVQIEHSIKALAGRPPEDPQFAACKWEAAATQVVMVTAGASLDRAYADAARRAWKVLGASRAHAHDAVDLMWRYGEAYSVDPVPRLNGKSADRARLLSLASALPPMFRAKKRG